MTQPLTAQSEPLGLYQHTTPYIVYSVFSMILLGIALWLTDGHFTFSLDDPYIHLALAENVLNGHYGINGHEYSAPSSSILWPFLIAPLSHLPSAGLAVWLLNFIIGGFTLACFNRLQHLICLQYGQSSVRPVFWSLLFILTINLLGLNFVGMEHQLQVFLSVVIFLGLFIHLSQDKAPHWLWFAIIAAPLVRYESLAISASALFYLFFSGYRFKAIVSGIVTLACLIGFTIFLLHLGLSYLPDSILVKSSPTQDLSSTLLNLLQNMIFPKSIALLCLMLLFIFTATYKETDKKNRLFFFSIVLAIGLHLMFGRTGWLFRYEIYIWAYAACALFYLYRCKQPLLTRGKPKRNKWVTLCISLFLFVGSIEHLAAIAMTPITSSNIYHQQVQMGNFVKDFYQKPVAVNDLGLVSFNNDRYILDLWGLGSSKARKLRQAGGTAWMDNLTQEKNVDLVMIYNTEEWLSAVPKRWIKIGELQSTGLRFVAFHPVSFYATHPESVNEIKQRIEAFKETLPKKTFFQFSIYKLN